MIMGNELSDINCVNAFSVPAVDKSNHRYLKVVKEFCDRAVACRRENDFICAIKNYNDALRIDRESAVLYNNRGVVYFEQNEFDVAISDFSKALKIEPDLGVAYYNRGKAWRAKGNLNRAIADFKKALRIDPDFSRAYWFLSRLLGSKIEHGIVEDANALEFFKKSQKIERLIES
jgi:tetratricopeptide (TPR) repeat protein